MIIETKVRKDGAINIKALGRKYLGVVPGNAVKVEVVNGAARIIPSRYHCQCCGKDVLFPITDVGICNECSHKAADVIRDGKAQDLSTAIKMIRTVKK